MRILLAATLLLPTAVVSAAAQSGPLVSVEWLAQHRADPDLVLLHVGPEAAYATAHLEGARLVSRQVLRAPPAAGQVLEMPDAAKLAADLAALGVTARSTVVVVFDQEWVTPATRVLVTLQYAGLGDRARFLDGGQAAWVAAGHPTTTAVPAVRNGGVTVALQPRLLASVDEVRAATRGNGVRIIDARAPVYYDGPSHGDHPAGHIPTARNIPYSTMVAEDNRLLSVEALGERFRAAGLTPGDRLIVYCHIGQQATLVFTAARLLGYDVRLYDGSFDDWAERKLPVEGGRSGS